MEILGKDLAVFLFWEESSKRDFVNDTREWPFGTPLGPYITK